MSNLITNFDFWGQIEGAFDSVLSVDFLDNIVFNLGLVPFFTDVFFIVLLASPIFIMIGLVLKITKFFSFNI